MKKEGFIYSKIYQSALLNSPGKISKFTATLNRSGLSWREPIKSRLFGNGKMLCWEAMVEHALEKSDMWRADLMTDKAWSLHPGTDPKSFTNFFLKS